MNSVALRKERAGLIAKQRAILNRADAEKRDVNSEENSEYEKLEQAIVALEGRIEKLESLESREDDLEKSSSRDDADGEDENRDDEEEEKERSRRQRRSMWTGEQSNDYRSSANYRKAFGEFLRSGKRAPEFRDVSVTGGDGGNYLALPVQLSKDIVVALNNLTFMRELCNVEQVNQAISLGCPRVKVDVSDSDWTDEVEELESDEDFEADRRDLTPKLLSKLAKISMRQLSVAANTEQLILERLAYKHAVAQEKSWMSGNGTTTGFLGVFTASSSGISTDRDVTASSTTAFNADDLLNTLYAIPSQYQASSKFGVIMHRDGVKMARKLKNAVGEYLLQPGIAQNPGDTLCGVRLYQSEYAPNTFTTGNYVAIFGDFNFYKVAEVSGEFGGYSIQRLNERYADTNQIGFIQRAWIDGMPTLENAFARLKLA